MGEVGHTLAGVWATLSATPLSLVVALGLLGIVLSLRLRSLHKRRIATLSEALSGLNGRIQSKDRILDEYRAQLREQEPEHVLSDYSDSELRIRVFRTVDRIRNALEGLSPVDDVRVAHQVWREMHSAKSEEERNRIWSQHARDVARRHGEFSSWYERDVKAETILLRAELRRRVDDGPPPAVDREYEAPPGNRSARVVADDLERMARVLKTSGWHEPAVQSRSKSAS